MSLNPTQLQRIEAATRELIDQGLRTEPIDQERAKAALSRAYALNSLTLPPVQFVDSPKQAVEILARLAPDPNSKPAPTFDAAAAIRDQLNAFAQVLEMERAARNPQWKGLGEEVDVQFNRENMAHIFTSRTLLALSMEGQGLFEAGLPLLQLSHAVDEFLENRFTRQHENWILYSGGSSNLWSALEEFAQMEILLACGELAAPTEHYQVGRDVLSACGWLFAMEELCVVCDRPAALAHPKLTPGAEAGFVQVTWRDGTVCRMVLEEDDDAWDEAEDEDNA